MLNRDFFDKSFLSFCQQEFDVARNFLKTCGKPTTEYDRWLITFNKNTVNLFKGYLS